MIFFCHILFMHIAFLLSYLQLNSMYDYGKYSPPTSPLPAATVTQTQMQNASTARQDSYNRHSATAKRQKYLRRLLRFRQMDFEYAFWQMLYLIIAPQKV
jgi:hypothetical protein